jgi:hypothetical protein
MESLLFTCPAEGCHEQIIWDEGDDKSILCPNCYAQLIVFQKADGSFGIKEDKEDGSDGVNWDLLVHQIINGEVIPVIGEDIVLSGKSTVKQMLIAAMCKKDNINLDKKEENDNTERIFKHSYSELIYHPDYTKKRDDIYVRVKNLIDKYQKSFKPSDLLKRILSIKQFPFVITTSIDPVTENAMRGIWEGRNRKVKTLLFTNDPKEVDVKGDLAKESDIDNPTIYYMFGKADTNLPHKFVVTDEDMLSFCQSWLTEGKRPKILSRVVGSKSLLFLGCNYPDWLVRFIWFSMRSDLVKSGMLVGESLEPSLEEFMKRVQIETLRDPEYVISQIEEKLTEKLEEMNQTRFDEPVERTDIFISYSRSDEEKVRTLYDTLTSIGLNVWYDRNNLAAGDRWLEKIKKSIESTKFFVAMVSDNMISQVNESHVYRKEWNMAIEHAKGMGSRRGFIIPIALDNTNFYDQRLDLPDGLTGHNALTIASDEDYTLVADEILKRINDLSK